MGHSQDAAVYKILNKMKTLWQDQLKISVSVLFKTLYRSRYKRIDVIPVQCPFKSCTHLCYWAEFAATVFCAYQSEKMRQIRLYNNSPPYVTIKMVAPSIALRGDFKTQPSVDQRFRLVSIVLHNDNCPEPDGTTSQPAVGFWSHP